MIRSIRLPSRVALLGLTMGLLLQGQCSGLAVLPVVPLTSPRIGTIIGDRRPYSCTRLWATRDKDGRNQRSLPILQNQETPQQRDDKKSHPRLPVTIVAVLLLAILLPILLSTTSTVSWAIDLPAVDMYHLKIPNPLPDADPRYFISGGVCAAASHGITTPLDVVKTKIQSGDVIIATATAAVENNNSGDKSLNLIQAATSIVQQEGFPILLTGLVPTVVGYGFEGALKFGLYESLKPTFVQWLVAGGGIAANEDSTTTTAYLLASVAAGAVASIVLCPMEQTRIRQVTDPEFADEGFVSGVARLTKEEGVGAIFFGLPAMLSKQVPYTMAKQVSFDLFATFLYGVALQYSMVATDVRTEVEFFAALLASILACLASHPGDVVLTATYKGGPAQNVGGFSGVVSTLYEQNGLDAFFSGIAARFFHVGAIITSQLILYDVIKQMLGLPATGTH